MRSEGDIPATALSSCRIFLIFGYPSDISCPGLLVSLLSMGVWVVGVVLFFCVAELYSWMQGLDLPLPLMLAAGLGLAIVSNLPIKQLRSGKKGSDRSLQPDSKPAASSSASPPQTAEAAPAQRPTAQLPDLNPSPPAPQPRSISFTIRKPENP